MQFCLLLPDICADGLACVIPCTGGVHAVHWQRLPHRPFLISLVCISFRLPLEKPKGSKMPACPSGLSIRLLGKIPSK